MPKPTSSSLPSGVAVIETMMGTRAGPGAKVQYQNLTGVKDADSAAMNFPAQYMFRDVPFSDQAREPVEVEEPDELEGADFVLPYMDKHGIEIAMIGVGDDDVKSPARRAIDEHPDRFVGAHEPDPNDVMGSIRTLRRLHADGYFPRCHRRPADVPDLRKCCELDIPIFCCAGVPGPAGADAPQHVERIDEVMYDFPELVFVTRHGCEPWEELAVKLMLKWPNLHYSTSAFAPKYYPKAIIDYANTRGADKIIYAGYFPMGLSLERRSSSGDAPKDVPFKDHVWPKFLRENADPRRCSCLVSPRSCAVSCSWSAVWSAS
jgi:uncharacterized protein